MEAIPQPTFPERHHPSKGHARSVEVRQRISAALKGKPRNLTAEQRLVISERAKLNIGRVPRSDEHKRRISEALKGKSKSADHIQNIIAAKTGISPQISDEERAARSIRAKLIHTGKVLSEETKSLLSSVKLGRSPLLTKYGINMNEYAAQRAAGMRWCCVGKHWGPSSGFTSGAKRPFCDEHKKEHHRAALLRGTYGIDADWYESTLSAQGGGCGSCGEFKISKGHNFMPIDHCHVTGKLRGILCHRCNVIAGAAESPVLSKVLAYLEKHKARIVAKRESK